MRGKKDIECLRYHNTRALTPKQYYQHLFDYVNSKESLTLDLHAEYRSQKYKVMNNTWLYTRRQGTYSDAVTGKSVVTDWPMIIRLHRSNIIAVFSDGTVVLEDDGWSTQTTHNRMTQFTPFWIGGGRESNFIRTPEGWVEFGRSLTISPTDGEQWAKYFSRNRKRIEHKYRTENSYKRERGCFTS